MKKEFLQLRSGGGRLQHLADTTGTALCGYKPEGKSAIGRKRAKWYHAPEGMEKCSKCQKKAIDHPQAPDSWQSMPCKVCGKQTKMFGTGMCDACWEVHHRMSPSMEAVRWYHTKWFQVRVFLDETEECFRVAAPCEQDARLIAYCMAGGFENYWEFEGSYALKIALEHTEIERKS